MRTVLFLTMFVAILGSTGCCNPFRQGYTCAPPAYGQATYSPPVAPPPVYAPNCAPPMIQQCPCY